MRKKVLSIFFVLTILFPTIVQAQSGCCSHHGGVAGCSSDGRQVCNDGTLSPSCTCTPTVKYVYGCTDITAKNYNSNANRNDNSCIYYTKGCTDIDSINYDSSAEKDDGSCIKKVYGCMDEKAKNYNSNANTNDNSCEYEQKTTATLNNTMKNDVSENDDSTNAGAGIFGLGILGTAIYFIIKKIKK